MTVKILVAYYSKTGNTEKLAYHVAMGAREAGGDVVLKSIEKVTREDLIAANGIIIGSPVYFGLMAAPVKEFFDKFVALRKKMENKVGAAFATSAHPNGGKETTLLSILQAMLIYSMIVVGDPLIASGHYGVACSGKPDEETLKSAELLGKRVVMLAEKIKDLQN